MYRKLSAHYIFPANRPPLKQGVVVVDDMGTIIDLIDTGGKLDESERLEFFDGIITPGFVNTHTHLELSHLKGLIEPHTGLVNFIKSIGNFRNTPFSEDTFYRAEKEMIRNGIVAAGDISNTSNSFICKQQSKLKWFTFIELLGIENEKADLILTQGCLLLEKLQQLGLPGTLTPHAPYSISEFLWEKLTTYSESKNLQWSVHNQECEAERLLFLDKLGDFPAFLANISESFSSWEPKRCSSLKYCAKFYKHISKVLLVHNTFTTEEDLQSISSLKGKIVLVLCPNANLFIENRLPNVDMIRKSGFSIALGTDSLASNHFLSVLEEMKTLQNHFPSIEIDELVKWSTINGAKALDFDKIMGSIEIGKKPGLNLITQIDFQKMRLTSASKVIALLS